MLNPTAPGSSAEIDHASRAEEIAFLERADPALMPDLPASTEIAAAITAPSQNLKSEYASLLRSERQSSSTSTPGRLQPGSAQPRFAPRPLALVPRLTRSASILRAPAKVTLLGVRIDCVTERQVISRVITSIRNGCGGWVLTPNVDHLRIISQRPDLLASLGEATLTVADGMPLIWASKLRGTGLPERVTGAGLTVSLTAAASRAGASIYLLGGDPGDGEAAAAVLLAKNPSLKIAGIMSPPSGFENDPLQMAEIGNALESAKPDLVYVCLGFPKQEFVIRALRHRLPAAWFLGLGGSLAIVSGRTRRAPRWMQRVGMEWFWRLGMEPRRLFQRYLVNDLPFAIRLLVGAALQR